MKDFSRSITMFSLCGLNCGLCPMNIGKYCPGCGGGNGNQSCAIARCSLLHGKIEFCFLCNDYPCYLFDDFDSFITHCRRKEDISWALEIGIDNYVKEIMRKRALLELLIAEYDDGRSKTLFSLAAYLLDMNELEEVILEEKKGESPGEDKKVRTKRICRLLKEKADNKGIVLNLRKKSNS